MLKYRLRAILERRAVVAKRSPRVIRRDCGTNRESPSTGAPSEVDERCRLINRENSSDSIESEK